MFNILLAFDSNYIVQATVVMNSILENNKNEEITFHIFHNSIENEKRILITEWLQEKNAKIIFYKIMDTDSKNFTHLIHKNDHVSIETFFRLISAKLISHDIDKILYIDCDTINTYSLQELFSLDITKYALAATVGICGPDRRKQLGLTPNDLYFQAGVLLINLEYWRIHDATAKLLTYARDNDYFVRWDQDILNSVFKRQWLRLPLKYNVPNQILQDDPDFVIGKTSFARQSTGLERREAINSPVILHFTGKNEYKPWIKGIKLINREKYLQYCVGIPFPHKMTAMPWSFFLYKYCTKTINRVASKIARCNKILLRLQKKILSIISPSYRNQLIIINRLNMLADQTNPNSPLMCNIQKKLNATVLHQKVFPKYKNTYQGRDIVLVATGATAKYYLPRKNAIHIGVNRAFMLSGLKLDYLFVADYGASIRGSACAVEFLRQLDNYRHADLKIFYGILDADVKTGWVIPESLALKHKVERYYAFSNWKYPPFKGVLQLESEMMPDNGSVSFHAFQFALFTNPKRIFLVGCDTALNGYFDGQSQPYSYDHSHVIDGWRQMQDFVSIYYPDVEIISINPVGLKRIFTDIFTDDYLLQSGKGNDEK